MRDCSSYFRRDDIDVTEIGDIDGDGKTDYRVPGENYIHGGPEFLSVIEGATGKELARTNYISLGTSEDWGDNYYKRSSSYRVWEIFQGQILRF